MDHRLSYPLSREGSRSRAMAGALAYRAVWTGSQLRDSAGFAPDFPFWTPVGVTMVADYSI